MVLTHEAGHLLAARLAGVPLRRAKGGFFGVRMTFDFSRAGYGREAAVHLAGPLAGIGAAFAAAGTAHVFSGMSLALSAVNLLPVSGFDGGGALLCLLRAALPPENAAGAEGIARAVSRLTRAALWLVAVRSALTPSARLWGDTRSCRILQNQTGKIIYNSSGFFRLIVL